MRLARTRPLPPVHPRVCGELDHASRPRTVTCGSSPRVRGTRVVRSGGESVGRFIPACAGNSAAGRSATARTAVHPRVCGELAIALVDTEPVTGSSPRVRGTRGRQLRARRAHRFIPACAGNSSHQRALLDTANGSSPRVRGTPLLQLALAGGHRFIPACAGNSRRKPRPSRQSPVHPRVCGELAGVRVHDDGADGSSPRVRGTRSPR